MRIIIFPWKMTSKSAKRLQEELQERGHECLRVFADRDYHPKKDDLIIFYGAGWKPNWWNETQGIQVLNHPDNIENVVDKIKTFKILEAAGVRTVPWTTNPRLASQWLTSLTCTEVFCRTLTQGKDGAGIVLAKEVEQIIPAPLYTKGIEAHMEYRVHVFYKDAFIAQEKRAPAGERVLHPFIRTSGNNWAFCRPRGPVPYDVLLQAMKAVVAVGLDFGGVDVLWNEDDEKAYILEVNSAPEIVGTDVENYASKIEGVIGWKIGGESDNG